MPQEHYQRVHAFSSMPVIHPALFFDDCSGTFKYITTGTGADWTAEYDPIAAHVQVNGLLLKTRETTPTNKDEVHAYRRLWLPPRGILRLQLMFSFPSDTPSAVLFTALSWHDGTLSHDAGLRFGSSVGDVGYVSGYSEGDYDWTVIPDWRSGIIDHAWNKVDLSVDLDRNFYHKLEANEHVLDGTLIPVNTHGPAVSKHVHLMLRLITFADVQATVYLDQILLTQETP